MVEGLSATLALAVVGVAVTSWGRRRVAALTVAAAAVSLAVSTFAGGGRPAVLMLIEAVAMVVLIFLVARRVPARQAVAAGSLLAVAAAVMIIVEAPAENSAREAAGGVAFWSLFALGAAGAAVHLNGLDVRRAQSIASARRSQRLELARDLHDFVAHDVSAIVVRAQAGRVVGERAPQEALAALEQIEEDGLRALAAMDRTVQALRDVTEAKDPRPTRRPALEDLRELTERFASSRAVDVHLEIEPEAVRGLPPEVTATGYRAAVEALTNVRRHAPAARRVEVVVGRERAALALTVTNDGVVEHDPPARRDGGFGLIGMRERVEALGGTVTAGPRDDGWQVRVVLPITGAS